MNITLAMVLAMMLNPAVTQDNIAMTICKRGWTATVRPPVEITEKIKRSLVGKAMRRYELDHFIPLELGGFPNWKSGANDHQNLWPQPWQGSCGARIKDEDERHYNRQVCAGAMTLADAQREIAQRWLPCR